MNEQLQYEVRDVKLVRRNNFSILIVGFRAGKIGRVVGKSKNDLPGVILVIGA